MRHIAGATVLILTMWLLTVPVSAQPNGPPSPDPLLEDRPGGRGFQELTTRLGLTSEQESTLKGIRQEFMKETADKRDTLHKKGQELASLFKDPKAKDADILAKEKEVSTLREQVELKAMEYRLKARKILTPEQLAKLPPGCQFGMGKGMGPGMCRQGPPPPPPPL